MWWPTTVIEEQSCSQLKDELNKIRQYVVKSPYHGGIISVTGDESKAYSNYKYITVSLGNWNRTRYLKVILNQYANQDYPKDKYKIVVVDDDSGDFKYAGDPSPEDIVRHCLSLYPDMNIELYQTHQDAGAPNIRWNVGLRRSTGDLSIVNESDVFPVGRNFLRNYAISYDKWTAKLGVNVLANPFSMVFPFEGTQIAKWSSNFLKENDLNKCILRANSRQEHDFGLGMATQLVFSMRGFCEHVNEKNKDGKTMIYGHAESNLMSRLYYSGKGKIVSLSDVYVIRMPNQVCDLNYWHSVTNTGRKDVRYNESFCVNDEKWGNPPAMERII